MTDETETLTVEEAQISDLTETLEMIQRLADGETDASFRAEVEIPASDAEAIRSLADSVAPEPAADGSGTATATQASGIPPRPSGGEVQSSAVRFDPPTFDTIRYATLALICWHTDETGDDWVSWEDLIETGPCPFDHKQLSSALSDLFGDAGALVRRLNPDKESSATYVFRPNSEAREYVKREGRFTWPGGDDPEFVPEDAPFRLEG